MKDYKVCYINSDDVVKFGFNSTSIIADERTRLVQRVLKLLLTKTNSNTYNPKYGSSFGDMIGGTFEKGKHAEVTSFLKLGVATVEKIILEEQLNDTTLSDEGRLERIVIMSVDEDLTNLGWNVTLSIYTKSGRAYIARI